MARIGELVQFEIERAKARKEVGEVDVAADRLDQVYRSLARVGNHYHACLVAHGAASLFHFDASRARELLRWRRRALESGLQSDAALVPMLHALVAHAEARMGRREASERACSDGMLAARAEQLDPTGSYMRRIVDVISDARSILDATAPA